MEDVQEEVQEQGEEEQIKEQMKKILLEEMGGRKKEVHDQGGKENVKDQTEELLEKVMQKKEQEENMKVQMAQLLDKEMDESLEYTPDELNEVYKEMDASRVFSRKDSDTALDAPGPMLETIVDGVVLGPAQDLLKDIVAKLIESAEPVDKRGRYAIPESAVQKILGETLTKIEVQTFVSKVMHAALEDAVSVAEGPTVPSLEAFFGWADSCSVDSLKPEEEEESVDDAPFTFREGVYLREELGLPLIACIAHMIRDKPTHPLIYLAHALMTWRYLGYNRNDEEVNEIYTYMKQQWKREEVDKQRRIAERTARHLVAEVACELMHGKLYEELLQPDTPEAVLNAVLDRTLRESPKSIVEDLVEEVARGPPPPFVDLDAEMAKRHFADEDEEKIPDLLELGFREVDEAEGEGEGEGEGEKGWEAVEAAVGPEADAAPP